VGQVWQRDGGGVAVRGAKRDLDRTRRQLDGVLAPSGRPFEHLAHHTLHGWVATGEARIKYQHWIALAWPPHPELVDSERLLDAERFDQHHPPAHWDLL
jgi:hypothetical protein